MTMGMSLMGPWWKTLMTTMNQTLLQLGIMKSWEAGRTSARSKAASKASGSQKFPNRPAALVNWAGVPCHVCGLSHVAEGGSHLALRVGDPFDYRTDIARAELVPLLA